MDIHTEHDVADELFAITVVGARFGVTPETLVRYEKAGLLAPKVVNDVRFYTEADVERLSTIRRLTTICGVVRTQDGRAQAFSGWSELFAALQVLTAEPGGDARPEAGT